MRKRRQGHILNFSSIGGLVGFTATGFYHATKFAVEGLSESLAKEVGPLGIKVLVIEPGPFRTDWAGRSTSRTPVKIEDYMDTVDARMKISLEGSGKQKETR
jgi:NAD(P)-dependent dehydrogenase (short-subunit alcohol dehydrogenase family)